ncbi:MAG: hypothetical protein ACRC14_03720 [Paracoccaceae bacterium]
MKTARGLSLAPRRQGQRNTLTVAGFEALRLIEDMARSAAETRAAVAQRWAA